MHDGRALKAVGILLLTGCVADIGETPSQNAPWDSGTRTPDGGSGMSREGGYLDAPSAPPEAGTGGPSVGEDAGRDGGMQGNPRDAGDDAEPEPKDPEPDRLAGITAAHNEARARVPTDMPLSPLSWSEEIAAVAQRYAEKLAASCSNMLVHSTPQERNNWGENLAYIGGRGAGAAGSPEQVVGLWESEVECYTYGRFQAGVNATCSSQCAAYGGCGHYTQVVWRSTMRVGCGVADCTQNGTTRSYWVCNYDPPGNYLGRYPY